MAEEARPAAPSYPEHIGKHSVKVEGDTLCVRFMGPYTPDEARTVLSTMDSIYHQMGRVFLLGDLTEAELPSPETRRTIADWQHPVDCVATAYFGASWHIRAVATLINSAVRMMSSNPAPACHAKTEAEARAWLAEQRQLLAATGRLQK